jgi:hypothetical protein
MCLGRLLIEELSLYNLPDHFIAYIDLQLIQTCCLIINCKIIVYILGAFLVHSRFILGAF